MAPPNVPPPSGIPKPSGPPLPLLLYALCLVPITAFAGYAITYGQDEAALEEKLRAKYGKEIHQVESKRSQMSELYMAAIKNPGSNEEQERRLQQVLRGGKGEVKRHQYDRKYYGTEEGKELQEKTKEDIQQLQEEERKKRRKLKRKLKKLKKKQEEEGGEASSESESSQQEDAKQISRKKKAAAAGAAFAATVGSASINKSFADKPGTAISKDNLKSNDEKKKKASSTMDMSQVAALTAVAGAAALVGFLVGGGTRRQ